MSQYTLEELHDRTANQIISLIKEGYRIDRNRSRSDDKNVFHAVLIKDDFEITIHSIESYDKYTKTSSIYCGGLHNNTLSFTYYRAYNNYYCDSKQEAEDLRHKYYFH